MYLDILLARGGRGWEGDSFSVPAPSCPIGKQLSSFTPLTLMRAECRWEGEKPFYTISCISTGICHVLIMEVPHPGLQGTPSTHFQRQGESMQCSFVFPCCHRAAHIPIRHSSLRLQAMVPIEIVIAMYAESQQDLCQQQ